MAARQVTVNVTAIGEYDSVPSYGNFAVHKELFSFVVFLSTSFWRCVV